LLPKEVVSRVHLQLLISLLKGHVQDGELSAIAVHTAGATTDDTITGTKISVEVASRISGGAVVFGDADNEVEEVRQLRAVLPGVHGGTNSGDGGLELAGGGGGELTGGLTDGGGVELSDSGGAGLEREAESVGELGESTGDGATEDEATGDGTDVGAADDGAAEVAQAIGVGQPPSEKGTLPQEHDDSEMMGEGTGVDAAETGATGVELSGASCLLVKVKRLVFSEA
jgi:hypothetical protein